MTRPRGMTLTNLYDIIDNMHSVYAFEDDKTYITNMLDLRSEDICCLEITTIDELTGVHITMQKGIERG